MAASPGSSSSEDVALRLDEESLKKEPEEVFELLEKLGEGSYGSVHQARHRATGRIIAIKQVPVDSDLQEIIKEISIMQQCECANIVRYYGSYFKQSDLWIVMEYCAAGSVADIMRILRTTLDAQQLASVLQGTLKGLTYLHARRKIHRDVKAGNILLDGRGQAKLADFGVAGQLSDTLAKRNTVIGTPFWMAPEVIQEVRGRPAMSLKPSHIPNTSCLYPPITPEPPAPFPCRPRFTHIWTSNSPLPFRSTPSVYRFASGCRLATMRVPMCGRWASPPWKWPRDAHPTPTCILCEPSS